MKKLLKWFNGIVQQNFRGVKAVYYKKEVIAVRVNDAIPINYMIAKKMFEGYFGHTTYCSDELMICYKHISERMSEMEYEKLSHALYSLGFYLYFAPRNEDVVVVGMIPDGAVMRYITDRTLRLGKFNAELLHHLS
jgi:hypothetical protein